MSIQWTIIASFLYTEIATVVLLMLPLVSAHRWQRLFKSRFLRSLERQSNLYFSVFIFILILFFLDAIRDVRKYTNELADTKEDSHGHLSATLQLNMKLFRAQRNFYISGFALFLWLVLRRLVMLISAQATLQAANLAVLKQAQNARDTAEKLMDEKAQIETSEGIAKDNAANVESLNKDSLQEIQKLKEKLSDAENEMNKAKQDVEIMKKQSESLTKEFNRVLDENSSLQKKVQEISGSPANKKDD